MMQHTEGEFGGARGASIYFQYWLPAEVSEGKLSAFILIAHGAAEHGGRYAAFAEHFTALGYGVAALDHDGHGRSDGRRCCVRSFDDYVEDLSTLSRKVALEFPDVPQVLLGHSMGGLIACSLLLQQQDKFVACVLSGAAIMTDLTPPAYQLFLIKILSSLLPNLGVLKLDSDGVSRDAAEVQRYVSDPLNHMGKMSVRLVSELFRAMQNVQDRAGEITLPILILHGGADAMTAPRGSEFLHAHVGSQDKTLTVYPELFHEIFNEPERQQVLGQIEDWLPPRISA